MNAKTLALLFAAATSSMNANAVDPCQRMTGTWAATYAIIDTFTDVFSVVAVARNGAVLGVNGFGQPMHGFCKKGVMYISEDYSQFFLHGYYFTPTFGRVSGTSTVTTTHDAFWYGAIITKISSTAAKSAASTADDGDVRALKAAQAAQLQR